MARTKGHGNPKWSRDEILLALELFMNCDMKIPSRRDPRVHELSSFLQRIQIHSYKERKQSFRNVDGVMFKLQNLRNVATGKGLSNVSNLDIAIWDEYGGFPERVVLHTSAIRENAELVADSFQGEEEDDFMFSEGRALTRLHLARERNPRLREKLLQKRRRDHQLCCDMCNVKPNVHDTLLEEAMFEVHHEIPIALAGERKTKLSDVALLCANCHRILHKAISTRKCWLLVTDGFQLVQRHD